MFKPLHSLLHFILVLFFCLVSLDAFPETFLPTIKIVTNFEEENIDKEIWDLSKSNEQTLKSIVYNVKKQKWDDALQQAKSLRSTDKQKNSLREGAISYVKWKKYSNLDVYREKVDIEEFMEFITQHSFLPDIENLRQKAEYVVRTQKIPYSKIKKYFIYNPPTDTESAAYLLESKIEYVNNENGNLDLKGKKRLEKEIDDLITDIWINKNFTRSEEARFLMTYKDKFSQEQHIAKLDRLIWDNNITEANNNLYLVDEEHQKLFKARIKLYDGDRYINNIIHSVPKNLREDEGLLYMKAKWLRKNKKHSDLIKLLLKLPKDTKYAEKWWNYRKQYVRELIKDGDYKKAYNLANDHGLERGSDFADAEWLSGWIALRFLGKPNTAYEHFTNLYNNVSYPISLSRGAYWSGRAAESMKEEEQAQRWYEIAAQYPTCFYGQIAVYNKYNLLKEDKELFISDVVKLPTVPRISTRDKRNAGTKVSVQMGYIVARFHGDINSAKEIFRYSLEESATKGEVAATVKIAKSVDNLRLTTAIARYATYKNVIFTEENYPILNLINKKNSAAALVHSVIKQESGFSVDAVSSAGAIGFMQLMPDTANYISKKIGLPYNKYKLSSNAEYNITLGSYYMGSLIEQFNGSELLAVASYNAGPNNVNRWLKEYYDPRKEANINDVIDWIELIPYNETRNYVHRIMEASIIYKYLLNEQLKKEGAN